MLRYVHQTSAASTFSRRNAEIDRFHWHARDDAQLTALSNLCEASSSAATNAVDSDAVLATAQGRRRPADAGTRAPAPFRRASAPSFPAPRPSRPHPTPSSSRRRRHCRGRLAVCSASRRRRRQPQEPGPQPSRLDARASAVQRDRAHRCRQAGRPRDRAAAAQGARTKRVVELAREKTPPPPPPPLKQ
jgi:hypothetical protein